MCRSEQLGNAETHSNTPVSAVSGDLEQSIRTAESADVGLWMSTSDCMDEVYTRTPLGCKGFDPKQCSIPRFSFWDQKKFQWSIGYSKRKNRRDVVRSPSAHCDLCPAFFTAVDTTSTTRGSNTGGIIFSAVGEGTRRASASAAATIIPGVMRRMRPSSAPRKMPGNTSTLLSWFG